MTNPLGVPIGWAGGTNLNSIEEVRREARYAVDGGFDSFWVSQIFGVDPIVALAAVATDVAPLDEVGTSVVPLYGRHPLALAAQALTAQNALGNRFTLGIGPSHATVVEGFLGESYARPYTRTREFIEAIAPLLRGENTSLVGDELTAHGWLNVATEPVPILLAAMGTRMLKLAARTTAGTSLGGAVAPSVVADHIAPTINAEAEAAGRPPPRIKSLVSVCVTDNPAAAIAHDRAGAEMYDQLPAYRAMLDRAGLESGAELLVAGSIDQVIEGLAAYVEAGATELRVGVSAPDPDTAAASREALARWMSGT